MRESIAMLRRYPQWVRSGCIFIHVPKAAGTSISHALYGRTLGHYTAATIRSRFPGLFAKSFVFGFVRNPWDRVLSAYRFATLGGTGEMGIAHQHRYQGEAFQSFATFLRDWLPHQEASQLDFVFRPQHLFVAANHNEVLVDFLGRTETLAADIDKVEQHLGRSLGVARLNVTSNADDYRRAYTNPSMVDAVTDFYGRDIELFGYSFE